MPAFAPIALEITAQTGLACAPLPQRQFAGGSLSACWRWPLARGTAFVKIGAPGSSGSFEAEAAGLAELRAARALRIPQTLACGRTEDAAFLALEYLEAVPADERCERALGAGLAALHAITAARFGWSRDNTIGSTPQRNDWSADWAEFLIRQRLRPQLELAARNGFARLLEERGGRLLEAVPQLLSGHAPAAALLHGDLWGGNWMATAGGVPAIFDPAVYFGDRETDLAMTGLFGGFGPNFYRAYETVAPLPAGAGVRRELYNLYHVLNHANLFGGGYARQAGGLIDSLLSHTGH